MQKENQNPFLKWTTRKEKNSPTLAFVTRLRIDVTSAVLHISVYILNSKTTGLKKNDKG